MVDFEILIKPAYVVNLTPEDHTVTEIVTTYGDLGYVQAKPKFIPKPVLVSPELSPLPNHHENPQNCIQMFVDEIMPGCSWFDNRFHEALFQQDPLYINCYNFKVGFPQLCEKKFDFLSPSLRTACPAAFDESQKLILKTFNERNGGVPEIEGRVPYDLLADEMIAAFKRNCVSDTELLNFYTQNLMSINVDSITEWITMQAPEVLKIIKASEIEHIKFSRLNYYYYMLKRLAKPSLEPHPERKFASPQAIAYQDKVVNAYISPVVRDMKQRMYSVMRKDKIVSSDMSVADFQEILNHRFPPSLMKDYPHRIEIDISKFDKSQGLLALLIDVKMMELFGVPEEMITLWFCMHITTRLVNLPQKFSAWVHYQRKSGDPMTFLGNTLFLIVSLCYLLGDDFKDMFGLFAGDDSYLFSKKLLDLSDLTNRAAVELNLEMKLLHFNYPYFCSKFLIPVDHGDWMVVPDMWKAIIKLGRSDLVNYEHVEQYRVSLIDNFKALEFGQYHYQYAVALAERYKMKYIPIDVFSAVHSLLKSKKKFADLYYIASGDVIDTERYRLPSVEI
nr:RNA-dependent RNA polymerase [Recilia dorsalis filamentous virus]